jgi:hypothetical protein
MASLRQFGASSSERAQPMIGCAWSGPVATEKRDAHDTMIHD